MNKRTISSAWLWAIMLSITVVFVAIPYPSDANGGKPRLMFLPKSGDVLGINFPGSPGGGGFTGAIYDLKKEKLLGSFTTDIDMCACTIFDVLFELLSTGESVVESVNGRFDVNNGTIFDNHSATLVVIPEVATTPGYEFVVVAVAQGEITGGTQDYGGATGTTSLYLKMEVDAQGLLPALAISGSFLFDLE